MTPYDQMHPVLQQALDIITIERNATEYTRAFAAVRDVISVFGERDLANRLFEDIPRTVPEGLVAELFDLLAWQTNDNGAAMMRQVEAWLKEGQDIRKLIVAMALEVYPFPDAQEMYQVMTTLAQATPEVAARCQTLITLRKVSGS